MRPNVTVIGAGSWGTTLASMCARHGPTTIWALEDEVVEEINARRSNSLYLKGFALPAALRATRSIEEATREADVVVLAVPSPHFRAVLGQAAPFVGPRVPVVSVAKGLEPESLLRMTEVIAQLLPDHPRAVLSGPNLAREVMAGYAAGAVVACREADIAKALQGVFNTGLYRVYTSGDVLGVEIAGALKNVIAIAAGMADGVGVGDNTRGLVISRGLAELTRLGVAMGGEAQTFAGLAGLGDLIATCISPLSRNRRVGEELGKGRKLEEIVGEMRMVAEGIHTCRVALELGKQHAVEMPITREIDRVVRGELTALQAYPRPRPAPTRSRERMTASGQEPHHDDSANKRARSKRACRWRRGKNKIASPSLRIATSFPSKRNSRGNRTACERPSEKIFARAFGGVSDPAVRAVNGLPYRPANTRRLLRWNPDSVNAIPERRFSSTSRPCDGGSAPASIPAIAIGCCRDGFMPAAHCRCVSALSGESR